MSYFRENPEVNSHHHYWHLRFNVDSVTRHGEFFYFMHHQMLARYHIERLSLGLPKVKELHVRDINEAVSLGYNSMMTTELGHAFGVRRDKSKLSSENITKEIEIFKVQYGNILKVIKKGVVEFENGTKLPLRSSWDTDEGIEILGEILESRGKKIGYSTSKYGNIHNRGHLVISNHSNPAGPMLLPGTSMRDPVFFRWHLFLENTFKKYKRTLPNYRLRNQLKVTSIEVKERGFRKSNELHTFFEKASLNLPGINMRKVTHKLVVKYDKLNHEEFEYKFTVLSQHPTRAMVRIFIVPSSEIDKKTPLYVQMDKYRVSLRKGNNYLRRKSTDSTSTNKGQKDLVELQEELDKNETNHRKLRFGGCGWPHSYLLPRGSKEGVDFKLFVMLNPILKQDQTKRYDPKESAGCGSESGDVYDSRPMGFPFDRPVNWPIKERNRNWMLKDIKIFHKNGSKRKNIFLVKT